MAAYLGWQLAYKTRYTYINAKICASIWSVKYIYKYIYKGSNYTTLRLMDGDKVS